MAQTRARSKAQPQAAPASTASPKVVKTTAKKIKKTPLVKNKTTIAATKATKATKATTAKKPKPAPKSSKPKQSPESRCLASGPNGPKVYDDQGFALSYDKCARTMRGGFSRTRPDKYMEMLEQGRREEERKREIMGGPPRNQTSALTLMAWVDRVARELEIPYHKVEMEHFEMLAERGFVGGVEGEFEAKYMSEEERERISNLATGSAFRA